MKKLLVLMVAAAVLSVGTSFAQEQYTTYTPKGRFYQVVPKHEFFFEGFGGFAPLFYDATSYSLAEKPAIEAAGLANKSTLWPWSAAQWLEKDEFMKFPVGIGYGGGFGYIAHITPTVGIMTGVQAAMYHGGINLITDDDDPRVLWTSEIEEVGDDKFLHMVGLERYYEMQQYLAVQVPLMLHLMAPMGKGNNHFYAAFGAKVGFNVYGKFYGKGECAYQASLPYSDTWKGTDRWGNDLGPIAYTGAGDGKNSYTVYPDGPYGYGEQIPMDGMDGEFSKNGNLEINGPLKTNLINAMASVELGFRWALGRRGCGLYTGLYADFGFLPMTNKQGGVAIQQNDNGESWQSIIVSSGLPEYHFKGEGDVTGAAGPQKFMNSSLPTAVNGVHSLHTGLKLKIAFGKVKRIEAPVIPVVPPKPDTVVKTVVQTVVVRDTVVQNNTIVVRDTVEKVNTVVVRDTVVVVKEIPQEIKDVMVELSNTLFAFNKFNLSDKAREGLNKVAGWLNDNPDVQVEISGHTDSVGSDSYNQKLSEQRAKSVYEYFIHEGGVSSKRLSYKGYGESRPIASNDTDEGRQQNRRVELNIIQ